MEVPKAIGSDVPNLMKDEPNFVTDVTRVPKCVPSWGSTPNHFLMGFKMKSWVIHVQMGVLEVIGSDVPRIPNCIPRWGSTPNHFLMS